MVVALTLFVALAMIGGGIVAGLRGYEDILIERNNALVISGAVIGAAGVLLAGLALVLARLGSVAGELAKLRERLVRRDVAFPEPPAHLATGPAAPTGEAAAAAALFGGALAVTDREPGDSEAGVPRPKEPDLPPPAIVPAPAERPTLAAHPALPPEEPSLSGALPEDERPEPAPLARDLEISPDPLLDEQPLDFQDPPPDEAPADPDDRLREAPTAAAPEPAEPRTVAGKYASGGNAYVMFSDGSIEAETPRGSFRFASLDELKEFIASGGESDNAA